MNYRVGTGYDVHELVIGEKLMLGGIQIPSIKGSIGHSDADVLLHAICDALLGAAALGDIGLHFPDTDVKWKNASSLVFLKSVHEMLCEKGFQIANIDATIILQQPKVANFILDMRLSIASLLQLELSKVSVKATTTEGLGFVGRGEGISAQAICLIMG